MLLTKAKEQILAKQYSALEAAIAMTTVEPLWHRKRSKFQGQPLALANVQLAVRPFVALGRPFELPG